MAIPTIIFITILSLLFPTNSSQATSSTSRNTFVLPLHKDAQTNLLVANIYGRTPLVPVGFVVELKAEDLWVNCETNYSSSTFSEPRCGSTQCKTAHTSYCHTCPIAARPFCHNNTCGRYLENPVSHQDTVGEVAQDVISVHSTDGSNPGPMAAVPNFLFTCAPSALVEIGLPKGVQGVLGLANGPIPLQSQLAVSLEVQPIFTMCIPSSASANGVLFFGSDGPFRFLPNIEISKRLKYTPLITDSFREYYINVKSISINQKQVPLNASLLSISNISTGGTTISTTLAYTVLEGSVYKAMTSLFAKQLSHVPRVKPIGPFGLCYNSKSFSHTLLGPGVPSIDLKLEGSVTWSIPGVNSMVEAKPGVHCLAFVNGGIEYRASINIGVYQLQDVLVQFDLDRSRFGFKGPLSGLRTHCENFNFTVVP